jgi:hypothetical protein
MAPGLAGQTIEQAGHLAGSIRPTAIERSIADQLVENWVDGWTFR